ncbi:uncharacterized protein LOC128866253 [Anastrepha ludens]|uniref:uncharacterized protein LOC128866253 n=1 Tax=Anastrepha ludens TaxID=28586 RepID=UPI0023AEBBE5|nr:uncharacterized protein LOC128866253 [Anastrepha ludens]
MDESIKMFQVLVGSQYSDIYMDALDYTDLNLEAVLEKVINSSIQNTESNSLALRLLNSCQKEVMRRKSHIWTSLLLKLYASCKEIRVANQIIITLGELAKLSSTTQESKKLFGSNHVKTIFDVITKEYFVPIDNLGVLRCMIILLQLYPEYSGQSSGTVKLFLSKFIDSPNYDVAEYSAKCYHLMLFISKHRSNDMQLKELWQMYQQKLIENLQTLAQSFLGHISSPVIKAVNCEPLHTSVLQLSDDPIKRLPQIFIRFRNFAIHLIVTLREPFSTEKLINPKKLLNLIKSAFGAPHLMQRRNKTTNDTILGLLLPQFYYIVLQILETLLLTLGKNLRRSYKEIWAILGDMKNLSTVKAVREKNKSYMRLLVKVYDVISLWCRVVSQGSRSDLISNFMMKDMLDIFELHTTKSLNGKDDSRGNVTDPIIHELIRSSQRCAYEILNSAPKNLKVNIAMNIEEKLINIYRLMCDASLGSQHYYEHRCDLIKLLFALLTAKIYLRPSSAEVLINIIRESYLTLERTDVRHKCEIIFLYLENCIHPQKDDFKHSIDLRSIQGSEPFENGVYSQFSSISAENNYTLTEKISVKESSQPVPMVQNEEIVRHVPVSEIEDSFDTASKADFNSVSDSAESCSDTTKHVQNEEKLHRLPVKESVEPSSKEESFDKTSKEDSLRHKICSSDFNSKSESTEAYSENIGEPISADQLVEPSSSTDQLVASIITTFVEDLN